MDPAILSILSALAAGVWAVWTWSDEQNKERQAKRDQEAALYVNALMLAISQLQSKLYSLLEEDELAFYKKEYRDQYEFASPAAIQILHYFANYFGWAFVSYRYGPYTGDARVIELTRRIGYTFEDRSEFSGDAFRFSLDERASLGSTAVRRMGGETPVRPVFESIPLYQFEDEINDRQSKYARLFQSKAIQSTVAAIDNADQSESLEGHERLAVLQNILVDLLEYLEGKEGFRVSIGKQKRARIKGVHSIEPSPQPTIARIIHLTPGRIRMGVPRIKTDEDYANRLQSFLASVENVKSIRMSTDAASVTVYFNQDIPTAEFAQTLVKTIAGESAAA
ncbi:MAG TPA: hypothetical protein VEM40_03870 [Nitrospirota bacterium]|nr:hypothetical protein [Nitrospirota bacterium]